MTVEVGRSVAACYTSRTWKERNGEENPMGECITTDSK